MNILQDDSGNYSMMRVLVALGFVVAAFCAIWAVTHSKEYQGIGIMFSAMVAALGALKWLQKREENKVTLKDSDKDKDGDTMPDPPPIK